MARCKQVQHIPHGEEGVSEGALRELLEAQACNLAHIHMFRNLNPKFLTLNLNFI